MSIIPESIQLATGACALNGSNELDFVLDGVMPIQWQRTYLSDNAHSGILGKGWSLPFTLFLLRNDEDVVFVDAQGREISFPLQETGQSFYSKYERITLRRTAVQQWELITQDGMRLVFGVTDTVDEAHESAQTDLATIAQDEQRVLLRSILDSNGNEFKLRYDTTGLLELIERSDGFRLQLAYAGRNFVGGARLIEVRWTSGDASKPDDPLGSLLVSYRYSSQGDLEEVLDGSGRVCQRFRYVDHQLVERVEASGLTVQYEWSAHSTSGHVVSMRHSTGLAWSFARDKATYHVRVTQDSGALSRTVEQYFDEDGHIIRSVDAMGAVARWERDAFGNVQSFTDPEGGITRYEYDPLGRTLMVVLPDGSQQTTKWFGNLDKPAAIADGLGRTTRFEWDERGNLLQTTEPDGSTTSYRYDERGLPVTIVDALGKSKQLHYNTLGQLTQYIDCSGQSTQFSWDLEGNVLSVTDALGQVTRHGYTYINRRQRLTYLQAPDGSEERLAYDQAGRLIAYQDPLKQVTRYQLDVGGNLQARTNALGNSLQYRYDGFGRLTHLINENGADYRFAWDAQDRLVAERGFDGRRLDYRYNRIGHLLEMVDGLPQGAVWMAQAPATIRTHYRRDALGRMLERRAHKAGQPSARTRLAYDAAGQLSMARNGQARVQLVYDAAGRISSEILHTRYGQHSTLAHRYDPLGNRIATTLPDGRTVHTLTYGSGHVHQIHIDGEVICDFERDALHREVERTQGQLASRFQLDPLGRLLASHAQVRAGQEAPRQVKDGWSPGALNTTNGQNIARRYSYDGSGQLRNIDDSRMGLTTYQYDAIGRLTQAMAGHATERFAFDPAHNLIEPGKQPTADRQDSVSTSTNNSDATDEQWAQYVKANVANPDFNLLQQGSVEPPADSSPEHWGQVANNRLKVWQEHRYQYDTWGNCIQKKSGKHQVQHFTWDAEHQLVAVQTESQGQRQGQQAHWCYAYDPFGRRIAKWQVQPETCKTSGRREPQQLTHFTWDGNRLLAEYSQASAAQAKAGTALPTKHRLYLYEPESFVPLAQIESLWKAEEEPADKQSSNPFLQEVMQQARNDEKFWYEKVLPLQRKLRSKLKSLDESLKPLQSHIYYVHTDHLGTPRELTNSVGDIVWAANYKAWGSTASIEHPPTQQTVQVGNTVQMQWVQPLAEEALEQNLRFQGQYFDAETGLHYNRFRYYDPGCGRFVSQDPIGVFGGENQYQYAPNPIDWIDPYGLQKRKLNQANRKDSCCKKWSTDKSDRVCEGNTPGVGRVKYYRNPTTGEWWSPDMTGHGGSAWKVFDFKNGKLEWKADANDYGDFIDGKHKGDTGRTVDLKNFKCKDL